MVAILRMTFTGRVCRKSVSSSTVGDWRTAFVCMSYLRVIFLASLPAVFLGVMASAFDDVNVPHPKCKGGTLNQDAIFENTTRFMEETVIEYSAHAEARGSKRHI